MHSLPSRVSLVWWVLYYVTVQLQRAHYGHLYLDVYMLSDPFFLFPILIIVYLFIYLYLLVCFFILSCDMLQPR